MHTPNGSLPDHICIFSRARQKMLTDYSESSVKKDLLNRTRVSSGLIMARLSIKSLCFLLVISFQIIFLTHGSPVDTETIDERSPPRLMCSKPGCECNPSDQDRATHVSCDCLKLPNIPANGLVIPI